MPDVKLFSLRLPVDLHAALVKLAERDTRSLHGEIIALLRDAVRRAEREQDTK
jgi:hypothetical protein